MRQLRGKAWLELALVLLILSISLAVLGPRLEQLLGRGQQTLMWLNARAFSQAVTLAQLRYQLAGKQGPVADLPDFLSGRIDFNAQGFPVGSSAQQNPLAPASLQHCLELWSELLTQPLSPSPVSQQRAAIEISYWPQVAEPGLCRYRLLTDPRLGFDYQARLGQVILLPGWQRP